MCIGWVFLRTWFHFSSPTSLSVARLQIDESTKVSSVSSLKLSPLLRTVWECSVVVSHVYVLVCLSSVDAMKGGEAKVLKVGCIAMVIFMMIWQVGIAHQISNLASIYMAQTWFFQGGTSQRSSIQPTPSIAYGYWIAIRYHLGTCIYAGLVILLISPIRLPLKIFTGIMQSRQQNPVGLLLWACFGWIEDCFYNNLEGISSHSIYDTVPWNLLIGDTQFVPKVGNVRVRCVPSYDFVLLPITYCSSFDCWVLLWIWSLQLGTEGSLQVSIGSDLSQSSLTFIIIEYYSTNLYKVTICFIWSVLVLWYIHMFLQFDLLCRLISSCHFSPPWPPFNKP